MADGGPETLEEVLRWIARHQATCDGCNISYEHRFKEVNRKMNDIEKLLNSLDRKAYKWSGIFLAVSAIGGFVGNFVNKAILLKILN